MHETTTEIVIEDSPQQSREELLQPVPESSTVGVDDSMVIEAFGLEDTNKLLGTSRLPLLPKELVAEEFAARSALLNCLNVSTSLEAIIIQSGQDSEVAAATAATLKMSLLPLWQAFTSFAKRELNCGQRPWKGVIKKTPTFADFPLLSRAVWR